MFLLKITGAISSLYSKIGIGMLIAMKAAGIFFIILALFGVYVLFGLNQQQGFKSGPYPATKEIIKAEDDPAGFTSAKAMGVVFIAVCFGAGVYLIRHK